MVKNLFIIYGGPGKEYEVSLSSGKNIVENLSVIGILCREIVVTKEGVWVYEDKALSERQGLEILKSSNALVFQVIHGTYGEDGTLVSLLEKEGVCYIGSSQSSLELTIDKFKTEQLLSENGICVPRSQVINNFEDAMAHTFSYPVIVKPKNEGSSVALHKVARFEALQEIILATEKEYYPLLVQEYISGREFTCGVVEVGGELVALTPTEIILTKGEMFDYEAKYTVGGCREVTPAEITEDLTNKIKELAQKVHILTGCKDISRTDMIMKEKGELVVLEINTVPGMTKTSFIPAQLEASGYALSQFIEGMLQKYKD